GLGIDRSMDGGQNWTRHFVGSTTTIVFDPADPLTVYAGGTNYLLTSKNGGLTWTYSFGSGEITALAGSPGNPSIIDIACSRLPGPYNVRVYFMQKSIDGGRSWQNEVGLPDSKVYALAVDPVNSSTLYAGTASNGVFKTVDGGVTWTAANNGVPG